MRAARTGRAQADPAIGGTLQVYAFRGRRARSHPLRNSPPPPPAPGSHRPIVHNAMNAGFMPYWCLQVPDALKPDIQCVRAHWIRGFIAFLMARRARSVVLMVRKLEDRF